MRGAAARGTGTLTPALCSNVAGTASAVFLLKAHPPYMGQILTSAFEMAQAFLILMTPDEEVKPRPELCKSPTDGQAGSQAGPNVLVEAGIVLAKDGSRTILVEVGTLRGISDTEGRHVIKLNKTPA